MKHIRFLTLQEVLELHKMQIAEKEKTDEDIANFLAERAIRVEK